MSSRSYVYESETCSECKGKHYLAVETDILEEAK